jgi:hypothetical protein
VQYSTNKPPEVVDTMTIAAQVDPGPLKSRVQYRVQGSLVKRHISNPTISVFEICSPQYLECGDVLAKTPARGANNAPFTIQSSRNMRGGSIFFAFFINFTITGAVNGGPEFIATRTGSAKCASTGSKLCNFY